MNKSFTYSSEVLTLNQAKPDSRAFPAINEGILSDPKLNRTDAWIPYGKCDDQPQVLREKAGLSYKHRACIERISNLVMGAGISFEAESDSEIELAKLFFEATDLYACHEKICKQTKLFGGAYPQLIYETDAFGVSMLRKVFIPDFHTVRLGTRRQGVHRHHYYHPTFKKVSNVNQSFVRARDYSELDYEDRRHKIVRVDTYEAAQVKRGTLSHMIGVFSPLQRYYPMPDYYTASALNIINSDFEISVFDYADIKNGLNLSYIIEIIRFQKDDPNEERKAKQKDRDKIREQLAGAENANRAVINWVQPDPDHPNRKGINITPIPSGNDKGRHEVLDKRVRDGILTMHGVTNPKIVAFPAQKSGGLNNNKDELVQDYEVFEFTSINPLQKPIEDFYNLMLKDVGIEAKAVIKKSKPVSVQMAESLMREVMTADEIRQSFGKDQLTDDQREELGLNNQEEGGQDA